MEKYIPCKWEAKKKAGVSIIISDKIDLKIKITKDKEGNSIMNKESIQEEDTIVNIYGPSIGAPQYIRQKLTDIKGEIHSNTITVGDFNSPITPMTYHQNRKLIRKHVLSDTFDEMDLTDIFKIFHPNPEEYTFSNVHGTFSRIDHILGHKSNLSKFKKIEIISSIFSDHNAMRLDINYKKKM